MYKLINNPMTGTPCAVIREQDKAQIPLAPDNTDYIAYLKWIEEGNVPTPSDTPA